MAVAQIDSFLTLTSRLKANEAASASATVMTPGEVNEAAAGLNLDAIGGGNEAEKPSLYQSVQGAGCKIEVTKDFDAKNADEIADLQDEIDGLNSDNEEIAGNREQIQQQLEQLKQQQEQQAQQDKGQCQGGGSPQGAGQGNCNDGKIQQLEDFKGEYQTKLDEATEVVNASNATIVEQGNVVKEADAEIEAQDAAIQEADENIEKASEEERQHYANATQLGNEIAGIDSQISALEPDLQAMKTEKGENGETKQVPDTEKRQQAEQKIAQLKQDKLQKEQEKQAELDKAGNVPDYASAKAEAQAAKEAAETKKQEAEDKISEAETNKSKAETEQQSLQNIIDKIDEKIDELENQEAEEPQQQGGGAPQGGGGQPQQADNSPMIQILEGEDARLAKQEEKNNERIAKLEAEKEALENEKDNFLDEIKKDDMAFLVALMKEEICIKGPNGESLSLEDVQKLIDELKGKKAEEKEGGEEAAEAGEFNIVG